MLGLHSVDNLQLQWHLMTYGYSLYCYEGSRTYLWAWKWISTACMELQDFCPVGISLCFYHSWKAYFNCGFCQASKLQKAFPVANEQKMHVCFFLLCATFYEKAFAPTQHPPPARLSPPPNYLQLNSEVPARKSNANPFEVDRASRLWRQLSSSNALSPSSIQKHMSKHERVPGSISQSIVCQLCQQTEGKLFHTHLNPGNLNHSFLIQTDKHAGHIQQICIAHLWLRSTRCHFLGELKIFGHHNLQYEIERHIFTHEKKKGGGLGLNHFLD